jgi:ribosomal protein S18 acetylase RimI-like enzyme
MNDLSLRAGEAYLHLQGLELDSRVFCRPCFQLDVASSVLAPDAAKLMSDLPKDCFITAKISETDISERMALQRMGFAQVGTELCLEAPPKKAGVPRSAIRLQDTSDVAFSQIGHGFFSRFHLDPRIHDEQASALWCAILSSWHGKPGHRLFQATHPVLGCVGVMLVEESVDHASLFFIEVADDHRCQGFGRDMIELLHDIYPGLHLKTEAYAANTRALNFYLSAGFTCIRKAFSVLHYIDEHSLH